MGPPRRRDGGFSGRPGWAGGAHRRRKAPGGKWGGPGAEPGGQPFKEPGLRWRTPGYPVRFGQQRTAAVSRWVALRIATPPSAEGGLHHGPPCGEASGPGVLLRTGAIPAVSPLAWSTSAAAGPWGVARTVDRVE